MQKDILSRKEIEALVRGKRGEKKSSFRNKVVTPYDFRSPELLSREKLRMFQILMEEFSKKIHEFFTSQLRISLDVEISSIHQSVYREFQERNEKTRMVIFTMVPFEGSSILEIKLPLIKFVNQSLLGDSRETFPDVSSVTPVEEETGLFLADKFLFSLKDSFSKLIECECNVSSVEKNPQLVFVASPEEPVIITTIRFIRGESFCECYFCFPYIVFDSLLPYLDYKKWFFITQRKKDEEIDALLKTNVEKIDVDVICELGSVDISLGEMIGLEKGDFLALDRNKEKFVDLKVGKFRKFKVKPGVAGKKISVKIEEISVE